MARELEDVANDTLRLMTRLQVNRDELRAALVARGQRAALFHPDPSPVGSVAAPDGPPLELSLQAYARACIERALRETGGDKCAAARLLKLGKSTIYRKLKKNEMG